MSDPSTKLRKFSRALFEKGMIREDLLPDIMEELGGPVGIYSLIVPADLRWFDPGLIEDRLSEARIDTLNRGAHPTPQELTWWQEVMRAEAEVGGGDCHHMVSLWRIESEPGQYLLCAVLHEDQGTILESLGPFKDREEAEQALRARGELMT